MCKLAHRRGMDSDLAIREEISVTDKEWAKSKRFRFQNNGFTFLMLFMWQITLIPAFNIDTEFPVSFNSPSQGFFGYSVAFLKNNNNMSWILAGAPTSNSTDFPDVVNPGEIFKCGFLSKKCELLKLDYKEINTTSDKKATNYLYKERKDNGWLGVSLDTTDVNGGLIAACAHRWSDQTNANFYYPNGVCYTINQEFDRGSLETLLPFTATQQKMSTNGMAQVGISAQFEKDSDWLLLGAPGAYVKGAGVLLIRTNTNTDSKKGGKLKKFDDNISYYNVYMNNLANGYSYFGYAVTSGKFETNKPMKYVFGSPRKNYKGMVTILNRKQGTPDVDNDIVAINGEQLGEYFGAAVCAVDLNRDGLDDLLIGAPRHSKVMDEGKVYVYINMGLTRLQPTRDGILGSQVLGAQFGSCIAVLGDTNMDGHLDFAIGAPYENGGGAVYIYHGPVNGINTQHVQKIEAKQASSSARGFGISIARGMDIDGNNYPDLLVGAFESNEAFVFRSQPLIFLSGDLTSDRLRLDTNSTDCTAVNNVAVSCFILTACVTFTGKFVPRNIDIRYTIEVDTLKGNDTNSIRVLLKSSKNLMQANEQLTEKLTIDTRWCKTFEVHASEKPRDFMTAIVNRFTYERIEPSSRPSDFCATCPLIGQIEPNFKTSQVQFTRDCGADDKCHADLKVKAELVDYPGYSNKTFVIGSTNTISLKIEVFNAGEAAYATIVLLSLPVWMDIDYKPPFCDFAVKEKNELLCPISNPLESNTKSQLRLDLNLQRIPIESEFISVNVSTSSDSIEEKSKMDDNTLSLKLPVKKVADINITGIAVDRQVFYARDSNGRVQENTTSSFTHAYEITNNGPSPVSLVFIEVRYPALSSNDSEDVLTKAIVGKQQGLRGAIFGSCLEINNLIHVDGTVDTRGPRRERENGNGFAEKDVRKIASINNNTYFIIDCNTAICKTITCAVGPMAKNSKAYLEITVTIDVTKLNELSINETAIIFTEVHANVKAMDAKVFKSTKVSSEVTSRTQPTAKELANWIIPVCIISGILLLAIIITALVKVGFFRRKKKENMLKILNEEKEIAKRVSENRQTN